MPCMGPSKPSPEQIAEVTNAVLVFINEKYRIWGWPSTVFAIQLREQVSLQLHAAIYEILGQEACESF
jgi:hypothetical protein